MEGLEVTYPQLDTGAELARPRLIALLFADWATQSKDHKIALGGIFDRLSVRPKADRPSAFYIYLRVAETYEEFIYVILYSPDGQPGGELRIDGRELKPTLGEPNYIQIVSHLTLEFPVMGVWWFDVWYRGNSLGRVPLLVTSAEEADGDTDER